MKLKKKIQGFKVKFVDQNNDIEYKEKYPEGNYTDWMNFYFEKYDGEENIKEATDKVFEMVVKMREAAEEIDYTVDDSGSEQAATTELSEEEQAKRELRQELQKLAEEQPEEIADLVRSWMAEE